MSIFVSTKDVMAMFGCSERTALRKMRQVRIFHGKHTGERFKGGGDEVTRAEVFECFNVKKV